MQSGINRPTNVSIVGPERVGTNPIARPDVINIRGRGPLVPNYSSGPPDNLGVPPASVINQVAQPPEVITATVNAAYGPIAIRYGRVTAGARIFARCVWNGNLVLGVAWGRGPIDAIEQVLIDDQALPAGVVVTNYTGTQVAADPTLVSAFAAQVPTRVYADVLAARAYSVLVVPPGVTKGFPRITAVLRGLKVYDPRIHPTDPAGWALEFTNTMTGGGNGFAYHRIDNTARLFLADDWLRYDVFVDPNSPDVTGGFEIDLTTAPFNGRSLGMGDGYGAAVSPYAMPKGVWITRAISLANLAGYTSSSWDLVSEADLAGAHRALYRNIRVTNPDGSITRLQLWAGAGNPNLNVPAYLNLCTAANVVGVQATRWSDNPALVLADFLAATSYGAGRQMDWTSVADAATYCDELVGSPAEKRHTLGLSLERVSPVISWVEALRAYAACSIADVGGKKALIPDKPRAQAAFALDATNSSLMSLKKRGRMNTPTVMTVVITDTSVQPWREQRCTAMLPGVQAGTTPYRESTVRLEGIQRFSQGMREAIERLNKLTLRDLSGEWRVNDAGLKLAHGDVIPVTNPIGLAAKLMIVTSMVLDTAGRWIARLLEYDPAVFSNTVQTAPTFNDSSLPDPNNPPSPAALGLLEEVFQFQSFGQYGSRFKATITPPATAWPYIAGYDFELYDGTDIVYMNRVAPTSTPVDRTPALREGVTYTGRAYLVSSTGKRSAAFATASLLCQGKQLRPGDVPAITSAFVRNGDVIVRWESAIDLDIERYEWRRSPQGAFDWDTATPVGRTDAIQATFQAEPVGSWTYGVKALDSLKQYSINARTVDVVVNSDADAFIQEREFQPYVGAQLVINGDFSSASGWVLGAGVSISGGKLNLTNAVNAYANRNDFPVVAGKGYMLTVTIDSINPGGVVVVYAGSQSMPGGFFKGPGTFTCFLVGSGAGQCYVGTEGGVSTTAVIDDFSIREVGLIGMIPFPAIEGTWKDRWVTSPPGVLSAPGTTFNAATAGTVNARVNPIVQYHPNAAQQFIGDSWDLGQSISGDFTLTPNLVVISGSAAPYIETSADGTTWTRYTGTTAHAAARFLRVGVEAAAASTFMITAKPKLKLSVIAATEAGRVSTLSSGGALVELTGSYTAARSLQLTPANTTSSRAVSWDTLLLYPQRGLMLSWTVGGTGAANEGLYHIIYGAGGGPGLYTIQAGDTFTYDVWIDSACPQPDPNYTAGGAYIHFTDGTETAATGDQNGIIGYGSGLDPFARGQWYSRTFSLAAFVGKSVQHVVIDQEGNNPGDYKVVYRNVRVMGTGGVVRLSAYGTQGAPANNAVIVLTSNVSNVKIGPANSFLAYGFNSATAAQTPTEADWFFSGF